MEIKETLQQIRGRFLYKFLKRNTCLQPYIENYMHERNTPRLKFYGKINRDSFQNVMGRVTIMNAFAWANTKQGYGYWYRLSKKFEYEWNNIMCFSNEYEKKKIQELKRI